MFKSYPSFPKSLLLSPSFGSVSAPALEIYNSFFAKLQSFLGSSVGNFSVTTQWNATSGVPSPVNVFMNEVNTEMFS